MEILDGMFERDNSVVFKGAADDNLGNDGGNSKREQNAASVPVNYVA